jgi:hypothetical protein
MELQPCFVWHSIRQCGRPCRVLRLGNNMARMCAVPCCACVPVQTGCVVVHVMGTVALQSPTAFTESFILAKTPSGQYYIANQMFRLM